MTLFNTLRTALNGLTGNKLRAVLTALGVIIGVASVIATLALGNGARAAVESNFRFLGSDQIQIDAQLQFKDNSGETKLTGKTLSYEDGLLMPDSVSLVDRVEMTVQTPRQSAARAVKSCGYVHRRHHRRSTGDTSRSKIRFSR